MKRFFPSLSLALVLLISATPLRAVDNTPAVGQNYNMICNGTDFTRCDPSANKQNESSCAVSSRNPKNIVCGANDYRGVDWMKLTDNKAGGPFVSVLKSFDGGVTFRGGLHPGCPQSDPACDGAPAIKGVPEGADPTIRSGPHGVLGFTGIVFDRTNNTGKVWASVWIDDNNATKVNEDTIRHLRTRILEINTGAAGQLQDKPWLAIDKWRSGDGSMVVPAKVVNGQVVVPAQTLPFGRMYAVWTTFLGQQANTSQTKVLSSVDGGETWQEQTKLSLGGRVQGSSVVIDPSSGAVLVFWRQIRDQARTDAVMGTISTNKGKGFSAPFTVAEIDPFDQLTNLGQTTPPGGPPPSPTAPAAIRIASYPTATISVDHSVNPPISRMHVAFAARTGPPTFNPASGNYNGPRDSRVMVSSARLDAAGMMTGSWTVPVAIDSFRAASDALNDANPGTANAPLRGHQFYPSMAPTSVGGKIAVLYYDTRDDSTVGELRCLSAACLAKPASQRSIADFTEVRVPVGNLDAGNAGTYCPDRVFGPYLVDAPGPAPSSPQGCSGPLKRRHTGDVRVTIFDVGDDPLPSARSTRVSRFSFGSPSPPPALPNPPPIVQTRFNAFNLKLFQTDPVTNISYAPFLGDYTDVAAAKMWIRNPNPSPAAGGKDLFTYNTFADKSNSPVFYGTWTSNHLVAPRPVNCAKGTVAATRDQNIFMAAFGPGLDLTAADNSKPLSGSFTRIFAVTLRNATDQLRTFTLTVGSPVDPATQAVVPGATASFLQSGPLPSLTVTVERRSTVSRSVFVRSSVVNAQVTVEVVEQGQGGLKDILVLNPDSMNPTSATDPANGYYETSLDITDRTVTNADLTNANLNNPTVNSDFTNSDFTNSDFTNSDFTNYDFTNYDYTNSDYTNSDFTNNDLTNSDWTNSDFTNSDFTNSDFTNSDFTNSDFTNSDFTNGAIADSTSQISNTGTTDAATEFTVLKSVASQCGSGGLKCQLLVHKLYLTGLAGQSCSQNGQTGNPRVLVSSELVANIANPTFIDGNNPNLAADLQTVRIQNSDRSNVIVPLKPKETLRATFRVVDSNKTRFCQFVDNVQPCFDPGRDMKVGPAAQALVKRGQQETVETVVPLEIITLELPTAVYQKSYTATVRTLPLGAATNFSIIAGALPPGQTLNTSTGVISGKASELGTFQFTVKITGLGQTDTQKLYITVTKNNP